MKINWKFLLLSSLLAFILAFVPPIENGRLKVSGKVKNHIGEMLEGVRIILMDSLGRSAIDTLRTNQRGAYNIDLAYQNKYRLYFEKEGYYKIFFEFNTKLPIKKELLDYYYSPPSEIMLADSFELNERTFRKNPITEIRFFEYYDHFRADEDKLRAYLDALLKPNVGALIVQGQVNSDVDSVKSGIKVYAVAKNGDILDSSYTNAEGRYEIESPLQEEGVRIKLMSEKIHDTYFTLNTQVDSTGFGKEFKMAHKTDVFAVADSAINTRAFKQPNFQIAYNKELAKFNASKPINDAFVEKLNTPVYDSMKLVGQLIAEGGKEINGAEISVFENDSIPILSKMIPKGDSIFNLNVPINKTLKVAYRAPGFYDGFIQVDSRVNDEKLNVLKANATLFDTSNAEHNPAAFDRPAEKYFYNDATERFESDEAIAEVFKRILATDPNEIEPKGSVLLSGTTRDIRGKKLDNVELIFFEDGIEVFRDTSDKKGNYDIALRMNKRYRMYCVKDGFYKHFMDINTKVPTSAYNEKIAFEPPIVLFADDMPEITNPIGFEQLPFEELSYSIAEYQFQVSDNAFDKLRDLVTSAPFDQLANDDTSGVDESPVYNAENTFLTLKGRIKDMNDKRLKDVQVFLMEDNDIIQITASDNTGMYQLDAQYDKELEVKFMDDDHFEAYFELYTDADSSYKNRELELEDMVLYGRDNSTINPLAFTKPMHRFVFNPVAEILDMDARVSYEFSELLETPLAKPLLTLSGRVKKNDGGYMKGVQVYLKKDSVIIDTVETDRKGVYQVNVPYNDKYTLVFADEKYHETFIDVDTRTALEEKDLRKESHVAETVELFKLDDESVEKNSFDNAFAEVNFNPVNGKFRNRASVKRNFLASVFKPRLEEEEILAGGELNFEEIEHEELEADEKAIEELLSKFKERAEQHKLAKTRNEIKDSRYRLASSMMLNDTIGYSKIQDVLLNYRSINNVWRETNFPNLDRRANTRDVADVSAGNERFNEIAKSVSRAMRKGSILDTIAIDSIFQVLRDVRIYESGYGGGVREVKRYIVKHAGEKEEYDIITRWFFFDTFIKNKEEIDEDTFYAELNSLKERAKL